MDGQPSRTAWYAANARAWHQQADDEPRIFCDPFAVQILGKPAVPVTEFDQGLDENLIRRRRLFVNGRSAFADELIGTAIAEGVDQVVMLGAGWDTTAHRVARKHHGVRCFEVDHPLTQEMKRHQLADVGMPVPDELTFVGVDFESSTTTLTDALADAGLDRTRGAVFGCLGVVPYLTRSAVEDMLGCVAAHGRSKLVLDYFLPLASAQLQERADRVAAAGEPWVSLFEPSAMREVLERLGFSRITDLSASDLLAGYGVESTAVSEDAGPHLVHAYTV